MSVRDGNKVAFVSVVSELELLVQPINRGQQREIERIRTLLDAPQIHVVDMDRRVAQVAAGIRANNNLALADAVVVSTAIVTDCDAIVGNDAHCAQRVREIPYIYLDALVKEQRS